MAFLAVLSAAQLHRVSRHRLRRRATARQQPSSSRRPAPLLTAQAAVPSTQAVLVGVSPTLFFATRSSNISFCCLASTTSTQSR